ncbi:23S rRNA (uracil(1939)-C(5))-methyltransferase RlmD [uncultured Oceanisphaera sp.]|uniref:23S rRNA (uracil(1939)-C(5))-methyltransferase RlmD n=1 Tax=uncultured Oceanisphaera sp. TaxID=353858 RepID=UPI0026301BF0|nr:23S rRNA (uracil(1939)-C(5))-methyltransferase RlmD [uncultured Oceanisphaera sp.]
MLKPGLLVSVSVHSLTEKGDGIATLEGRPLYIEGALPDEQVEVQLNLVKPNFCQGSLVRVLQPAAARREDFCRYTACGGCQLRVMNDEAQLELKRRLLVDVLQAKGLDCPVANTLGMSEPFHYRNKAQYAVKPGPEVGFYAKHSHQLVEVDECRVQAPVTTEVVQRTRAWMRRCAVSAYNEATHSGSVRHIMVRDGIHSGELMVVLVVAEAPSNEALAQLVTELESVTGLASLMLNINAAVGNRVLGPENRLLWGKELIVDSLDGLEFAISPLSFYQVNPRQTEVLYREAMRLAKLQGNEVVFDLYCGIGTISLFMARHARQVIGIELVPEAIADARANAELNGITNIEFHQGAAEQLVPRLYAEGVTADVVVVDPPRKGCDAALLATLAEMQPERLVYVSCNPKTLARDLAWLCEHGFKLEQATPVDMFPHTMHVETVALLTRVKDE